MSVIVLGPKQTRWAMVSRFRWVPSVSKPIRRVAPNLGVLYTFRDWGVSDRLAPSTQGTNWYETQHISHLRIQYDSTSDCWHILTPDGYFYDLGCSSDAKQFTSDGDYRWDVNKIVAPFESTQTMQVMYVSYLQDKPRARRCAMQSSSRLSMAWHPMGRVVVPLIRGS